MKLCRHLSIYLALGWALIIIILCLIPANELPAPKFTIPHLDKIVHIILYFVFGILMQFYLYDEKHYSRRIRIFITIIITSCFGAVIEYLQEAYFNRSSELEDLIANFIGIILSVIIYLLFRNHIKPWYNNLKNS